MAQVSIIVPVYRAESYIAETIAMVIRQSYREWELLLVEDCSPDNSAKVIRSLLAKYECHSLTAGNHGIRSAEEYTDGTGRRIVLICKEKK